MPLPQGQLLGSEEVQQNVSARFEQACAELKLKGERQRAEQAQKDALESEERAREDALRPQKDRLEDMRDSEALFGTDVYKLEIQEQESRDALLEEDAELDKLREARLAQMKKQREEYLENVSKGHGQYDEIVEAEFLKTVLASKFAVVHFYSDSFERCKIMDKHLKMLATKHVETKFCKINAEKTPFFVEKLAVRTLPSLVFFEDGKAIDRLLGFQGLEGGDDFETRALEERIGVTGVVKMEREFYSDRLDETKTALKQNPAPGIFAAKANKVEESEDPFDD